MRPMCPSDNLHAGDLNSNHRGVEKGQQQDEWKWKTCFMSGNKFLPLSYNLANKKLRGTGLLSAVLEVGEGQHIEKMVSAGGCC